MVKMHYKIKIEILIYMRTIVFIFGVIITYVDLRNLPGTSNLTHYLIVAVLLAMSRDVSTSSYLSQLLLTTFDTDSQLICH